MEVVGEGTRMQRVDWWLWDGVTGEGSGGGELVVGAVGEEVSVMVVCLHCGKATVGLVLIELEEDE